MVDGFFDGVHRDIWVPLRGGGLFFALGRWDGGFLVYCGIVALG